MQITIKYKPGDSDPWSQAPDKKIKVGTGQTELTWSIQLTGPNSAGGTIAFDTNGIQFTDTGNKSWPGSAPTPQNGNITSTINNQLQSGSNAVSFHYRVNALYTPQGGTQQSISWDPEVQEDPPVITVG